ncbi:hypothetical protein [Dokdonella sp.]|uniref:hypothetical protein n=1 Tax=Dokdonella sp. TaxID=2291710 RepID=UPI00378334E3
MSRRLRVALGLFAMIGIAGPLAPCVASQDVPAAAAAADMSGLHDFDFLVGEWRVHSRRLKEALADSHEWYEFDGTIRSQPLMDGRANVDDTVFNLPTGIYRGVAPRAYDPQTGQWAIWWIDGRNPFGNLDPPVKGRFVGGVGTFYANDTLRGKPIRVRFTWSRITKTTAEWEQAFSPDDGKTWETNWQQKLVRSR